jgi:hypothetical protein
MVQMDEMLRIEKKKEKSYNDDVGMACRTRGGYKKCIQNFSRKSE